jgi:hypothetical protein
MAYYDSKLIKINGEDYSYQKVIGSRENGSYILYFRERPFIIRKKVKEIKEFVKAHYEKRRENNFQEPKYECEFFNPFTIK